MPSFAVNITNHTLPAVSVTIADAGNPPLTYSQVKNSLGNDVYSIIGLYLYSNNIRQLTGVIQYNRYDVTGNQLYNSIVTAVDPYQQATSLNVDLKNHNCTFILNGNSNLSTTVLANAYIQFTMHCKRIRNSYGLDVNNFELIQEVFKKGFFNNDETSVPAKKQPVGIKTKITETVDNVKNEISVLAIGVALIALSYFYYNEKGN